MSVFQTKSLHIKLWYYTQRSRAKWKPVNVFSISILLARRSVSLQPFYLMSRRSHIVKPQAPSQSEPIAVKPFEMRHSDLLCFSSEAHWSLTEPQITCDSRTWALQNVVSSCKSPCKYGTDTVVTSVVANKGRRHKTLPFQCQKATHFTFHMHL